MAADSQMSINESYKSRTRKLFHFQGHMIGFAGDPINGAEFVEWYKKKIKGKVKECAFSEPADLEALVVTPELDVFLFDERCVALHDAEDFCAIGTGALAALAAMECGKTAVEAVNAA